MGHSTSEHFNPHIHHSEVSTTDTGKKLSDVAGQATLPETQHPSSNQPKLSKEALAYVGRYHFQMSCEDSLNVCDQSDAEYILTLLADGTAHQTIIGLGRLASESSIKAKTFIVRIAGILISISMKSSLLYKKALRFITK